MNVSRRVKVNQDGVNYLFNKTIIATEKTAEAIVADVKNAQTIPFDVGTLQLSTTWERAAARKNIVRVMSNTPYARRLYHHPEYNFRKTNNENAGAGWFDPYINGDKADAVVYLFQDFMKKG